MVVFFFQQKTAYEMRISDWSSDVYSSDLVQARQPALEIAPQRGRVASHRQGLAAVGVTGHQAERRLRQPPRLGEQPDQGSVGLAVLRRLGHPQLQQDRKSTRLNSSH